MPVLPISYMSNYYIVEVDYTGFFSALGISGFTPVGNPSNPAKLIASKFEIEHVNDTSPKPGIQGKPGVTIEDVTTPTYRYTIEAPLLIGTNGFNNNDGFFPYNSLTYFALWLTNWQWQQLYGYSANPNLNSLDYIVAVEEFKISVSETQITQRIVLVSNVLLNTQGYLRLQGQTLQQIFNDPTSGGGFAYNQITSYFGRVARNYDVFANLFFNPGPDSQTSANSFYLAQEYFPGTPNTSASQIFLTNFDFGVKFTIEKKYFTNVGNQVVFAVKDYDLNQSVEFVGFANSILDAFDFTPGAFLYFYTTSNISIGAALSVLLRTTMPLLISSRKDELSNGQLVKSNLDLKLYGATFNPLQGNLFTSAFA